MINKPVAETKRSRRKFASIGCPLLRAFLLGKAMKRPNITGPQRQAIVDTHQGLCKDCGVECKHYWRIWKPLVKHFYLNGTHEIHHIVPVKNGGQTTPNNLVLLCISCHKKRHNIGGK